MDPGHEHSNDSGLIAMDREVFQQMKLVDLEVLFRSQ